MKNNDIAAVRICTHLVSSASNEITGVQYTNFYDSIYLYVYFLTKPQVTIIGTHSSSYQHDATECHSCAEYYSTHLQNPYTIQDWGNTSMAE